MTEIQNVVQTEAIQAIREGTEAIAHNQEFWDMFQSSVNTQELPPVTKFTYLKGILRGQAAAAISGIAITEENYDIALRTL